jgi:multidrug efflux pump
VLSDLAVRRPVLTAVGAIILCLFGLIAFLNLPVRELPAVDPPVVTVQTTYVGASAEVVEERITQLIEQQIAGIQGIDRVNSSSRDGVSTITVTFNLDRDIESAANDIRDSVSRVVAQLPVDAKPPQVIKSSADFTAIVFLGLTSDRMDRLQLVDYAQRYLVPRLSTIPGAGIIGLAGAGSYSMRVWLDADAMAARGVTVEDVETALSAQNLELPAGALEGGARDYTIRMKRRYGTPQGFAQLPIAPARPAGTAATGFPAPAANPQGPTTAAEAPAAQSGSVSLVRLGDIARIEEGPLDRRTYWEKNGHIEVGLSVLRQSQANDLALSQATRKMVADINAGLPPGMKLEVIADYSAFTAAAIRDVWITLAAALLVVAGVNLLFLGSWRAAAIPALVAPICLVSAFIVLALARFSMNLMTLLALVLAIGLVVDDAIMVVENIQRRVDEGEPPEIAARLGARQVFFAVLATTAVLMAVFAPLLILPGYTGRLFVELAATVTAAVFFSAVLALSLSPMLASRLLRPAAGEGRLARAIASATHAVRGSYRSSLEPLLDGRTPAVVTGLCVLALALAAAGLAVVLPKALTPPEDRGRVGISIQAPEGADFDYTVRAVRQAAPFLEALRRQGLVQLYTFTVPPFGNGIYNTGTGTAVMTDWSRRKVSADELTSQLNRQLGDITSARIIASVPAALQRGGAGANVDFIVSGDDYDQIARWIAPIQKAAQANAGLSRPRLDYEPNAPRLLVDVDDARAAAMGVSTKSVGEALQVMFGSQQVTTYIRNGEEYYVTLQTARGAREKAEDLDKLNVRTASGALAPLSALVKTSVRGDTADRRRIDRLRSITLSSELNPGYTVGQAVRFYRDQAARQPQRGFVIRWGGQAKDYLEASSALGFALGMALLLVFLVLAAQFESWIQPAVIMLTVPLAALGGLCGLALAGSSINIYSEVGLIILVGISAKNGILIVEFANQLRAQGRAVREAVLEAASVRLRPVVMTSLSAVMGATPLMLAGGPGAGSQRTIGVTVFTGAIFGTLLTLFVAPVFYNLLAGPRRRAPEAAQDEARPLDNPPLRPAAAE